MRRNFNNRSGFTLVEAMMAMVVLALAVTGVLLPYSSAASVHAEGSRQTLASKLAADLVEEIVLSLESGNSYFLTPFYEAEGEVTKYEGEGSYSGEVYKYFSRESNCQRMVIGTGRNVTELGTCVTVTVSFDGREMVTLKTLVSN